MLNHHYAESGMPTKLIPFSLLLLALLISGCEQPSDELYLKLGQAEVLVTELDSILKTSLNKTIFDKKVRESNVQVKFRLLRDEYLKRFNELAPTLSEKEKTDLQKKDQLLQERLRNLEMEASKKFGMDLETVLAEMITMSEESLKLLMGKAASALTAKEYADDPEVKTATEEFGQLRLRVDSLYAASIEDLSAASYEKFADRIAKMNQNKLQLDSLVTAKKATTP